MPCPPTAPTCGSLDASTGALVQVLNGFDEPDSVSSDGTYAWVANYGDNTVTAIDTATGVGKVLSGSRFGFDGPTAISSDGTVTRFPA